MSEETPRSSGSASPFGDGSFSWSKVTVDGDAPTARSSHVAVLGENDTLIIHGGFGNGVERGDFFHVNLASMESSYVAPFDKANKIIRIGHAA